LINPNAAHLEAPRNLRRTIPAIQGSQHALPQILRIGLHLRLPSTSRKYYRMKCIYLNRKRFRPPLVSLPEAKGLIGVPFWEAFTNLYKKSSNASSCVSF